MILKKLNQNKLIPTETYKVNRGRKIALCHILLMYNFIRKEHHQLIYKMKFIENYPD